MTYCSHRRLLARDQCLFNNPSHRHSSQILQHRARPYPSANAMHTTALPLTPLSTPLSRKPLQAVSLSQRPPPTLSLASKQNMAPRLVHLLVLKSRRHRHARPPGNKVNPQQSARSFSLLTTQTPTPIIFHLSPSSRARPPLPGDAPPLRYLRMSHPAISSRLHVRSSTHLHALLCPRRGCRSRANANLRRRRSRRSSC